MTEVEDKTLFLTFYFTFAEKIVFDVSEAQGHELSPFSQESFDFSELKSLLMLVYDTSLTELSLFTYNYYIITNISSKLYILLYYDIYI